MTVPAVAAVMSVATLLVSVAALVATAMTENRTLRRLVWVRRGCAAAAALLVAGSLADLVPGPAPAAACIALLLSLHALWIATHRPAPLQAYLDRLTAGGDATWRTEFERPFAAYVRRRGPRLR